MIVVAGWIRLEPGEIERLADAAVTMMAATRSEDGCLDYAFARDLAEPDLLRLFERWRDEAALAAHFATPHMGAFNAQLAGARIVAASIKVYAGEAVRTLIER